MANELNQVAPSSESVEGFINESEVLKRVPVSRRTWYAWRESGEIPCVRLPGSRRVLYHWPTVQAALLRRQRGATGQ
jgi:predicted site-specific integrase-resolvase